MSNQLVPAPPEKSLQETDPYARGIKRAADALRSIGFATLSESTQMASLSYRLPSFQTVVLDFKIQDTRYVKHIAGRGRTEALANFVKCQDCLQITLSTRSGTQAPVYIELPPTLSDPAQVIYENVLLFLRRPDLPALPGVPPQLNQGASVSSVK